MAEKEKAAVEKAAKPEKPAKAKRSGPSLLSRIGAWFRSVKAELKKITWTSFASVRSNSIMTLVVIVIFAAAIGVVDYIFSQFIYILGLLI